MIKFTAHGQNGRTTIGLGLSELNIQKLKEGMPINIFLFDIIPNLKEEIVIFYGATEQTMKEELERLGLITEKTNIIP